MVKASSNLVWFNFCLMLLPMLSFHGNQSTYTLLIILLLVESHMPFILVKECTWSSCMKYGCGFIFIYMQQKAMVVMSS